MHSTQRSAFGTPLSTRVGQATLAAGPALHSPILPYPSTGTLSLGTCDAGSRSQDVSFSMALSGTQSGLRMSSMRSGGTRRGGAERSNIDRRECMKTISRFLASRNFPQITPKQLSNPTNAVFFEITTFLISLVDPQWKCQKPTEEIPAFYKALGYPTQITKSAMLAPCAPNTWQQHLACLAWLCELLSYEEEVFPSIQSDDEVDDRTAYTTLTATAAAYRIRLDGDEEPSEIGYELGRAFDEHLEAMKVNLAKAEKQHEEARKAVAALQNELREAENMKQKMEKSAPDQQKLASGLERSAARVALNEQTERRLNAEVEEKKNEVERIETANRLLRREVDLQETSVDDMRRMEAEGEEVKQKIQQCEGQRSRLLEDCRAAEKRSNKAFSQLELTIEEIARFETSLYDRENLPHDARQVLKTLLATSLCPTKRLDLLEKNSSEDQLVSLLFGGRRIEERIDTVKCCAASIARLRQEVMKVTNDTEEKAADIKERLAECQRMVSKVTSELKSWENREDAQQQLREGAGKGCQTAEEIRKQIGRQRRKIDGRLATKKNDIERAGADLRNLEAAIKSDHDIMNEVETEMLDAYRNCELVLSQTLSREIGALKNLTESVCV